MTRHMHKGGLVLNNWSFIAFLMGLIGVVGISCPVSITFKISEPVATPVETVDSPPAGKTPTTSEQSPFSSQSDITPYPSGQVLSAEELSSGVEEAPDFAALERYMLELINTDREASGLDTVEWDDLAARAGRLHALEMARFNYLSHWNRAGYGPEIRFGLMGGMQVVQENVYAFYQRYDTGEPLPIAEWDWFEIVRDAQESFMQSPGHRANILDPHHTHVGIGIAFNPSEGEFRLAQEFTQSYVEFLQPDSSPIQARPGDTLPIQFRLLNGNSRPVINLAYQSFPSPLELSDLHNTNTYSSPAEVIDATPPLQPRNANVNEAVQIPVSGVPGYYHIRVWMNLDGEDVLVGNLLVIVEP